MLEAKNLSYKEILDIPLFFLEKKSFTVLLGQNGSGKSTFLKALCGLNDTLSSKIILNGEVLSKISPKKRAQSVSWLPANTNASPELTVEEICLLGRYPWNSGVVKKEDKLIVSEILSRLGLKEKSSQSYLTLSSGEQRLTDISRVLSTQTDLLILDEPTTHLDLKKSFLVFSLLKEKVEKEKKTVLITSHNLELTKKFATHVFFMKSGSLLLDKNFQALSFEKQIKETFELEEELFLLEQ
jgi:iron-chelate-transporting ATPase